MDTDLFTVSLRFDARDDKMRERVQACLAKAKRVPPERLAMLLGNGRLIVQRNADAETAHRLKVSLEAIGAHCRLVRQSHEPPEVLPASISGSRPANDKETAQETMTCPQCGFAQAVQDECRACGIIIAKARHRAGTPSAIVKATPEKNPAPPIPDLTGFWQRLRRRIIPKLWACLRGRTLGQAKLRRWSQKLSDALVRCALVFGLTLLLETGVLYIGRALWFIYIHTPTGEYYANRMGDQAAALQNLMKMDLGVLGLRATLLAFLACLAAGALVRVTHLMRYFYEPRGLIGKLLWWCLPMTAGLGWLASQQTPWPSYTVACMLMAAPALCLLSTCFNLTEVLLPEARNVFNRGLKLLPWAGNSLPGMKKKLREWFDILRRTE